MNHRIGRRNTNLDVLRAIAALGVLVGHASNIVAPPAHPGSPLWVLRVNLTITVDLFFALSGYLIAGPFLRALLDGSELPAAAPYILRRCARIAPAYWIALLALVGMLGGGGASIKDVATHLTLVQNEVPGEAFALYPVAWTLGIELSFYLMMPLAAAAVRRRWRAPISTPRLLRLLGCAGVASWGLSLLVPNTVAPDSDQGWTTVVSTTLPATLYLFVPGMIAAVLEHTAAQAGGRRQRLPHPTWLICSGAGLITLALLPAVGSGRVPATTTGVAALAFGLVVLGAVLAAPARGPLGRALGAVGTVSYGLYLWHGVIIEVAVRRGLVPSSEGGHAVWLATSVVLFVLAGSMAAVSWRLVEKPALRWASAAGRRDRARARACAPITSPSPIVAVTSSGT